MPFDQTLATSMTIIPYERAYDLTLIVQEFVYRYYMILTEAPHEAWRNYMVDAQYMHVDGEMMFTMGENHAMKPAVGQHQINSNIMHQQFFECEFHVRSINVQQTATSHMVLVTGDISRNRNAPVTFVQTFLIECIPEINQYAICNSILNVFTVA